LDRFEYLSIVSVDDRFLIKNKELDLIVAAGELEKCLVAF